MSCPVCSSNPDVLEEAATSQADQFCNDCGLASLPGDKFCRQCGQRADAASESSAAERFCRQCGSRRTAAVQNAIDVFPANESVAGRKPWGKPRKGSRVYEAHAVLIAAMWILTAASWVSLLALETTLALVLDVAALLLALTLSFLPSWTDRINGWTKVSIELVVFANGLLHR